MKIDIFGCCFSRDTIMFQTEQKIQCGIHIHYASALAATKESVLPKSFLPDETCLMGDHNFVRRNIFFDWTKEYWKEIERKKSEWCIVDFGNIRFDLGKITRVSDGEYQYITYSQQAESNIKKFLCNDFLEGYKFEHISIFDVEKKQISGLIINFIKKLLKYYDESKIVLIDGRACKYYHTLWGGVARYTDVDIEKINSIYEIAYQSVLFNFPNVNYIPFIDYALGEEKHKWNLYYLHYTYHVYSYFYLKLKQIIFGEDFTIELEEICKKNKEKYESSVQNTIDRASRFSEGICNCQIEKGGISGNSYYDPIAGKIFISGWFLPVYAYNIVNVYLDNEFLGQCSIHNERKDVEVHNPYYVDARFSGFLFEVNLFASDDQIVKIEAKWENRILTTCKKSIKELKNDTKI